jgi:hypothetical protein
LVIDPSLSPTGPLTLPAWAAAMRARFIEIAEAPLTQALIHELQRARVLAGGDPLDAVVFSLERGKAPLADVGGSGFRIAPDPPEGASVFARVQMQKYLELQAQRRLGREGPR